MNAEHQIADAGYRAHDTTSGVYAWTPAPRLHTRNVRRHFSWLPWILLALVIALACDLPTSSPLAIESRIVIVESAEGLAVSIAEQRRRGCVLRMLHDDPGSAGVWAVYDCARVTTGSAAP